MQHQMELMVARYRGPTITPAAPWGATGTQFLFKTIVSEKVPEEMFAPPRSWGRLRPPPQQQQAAVEGAWQERAHDAQQQDRRGGVSNRQPY